jgi:hypothetical protein
VVLSVLAAIKHIQPLSNSAADVESRWVQHHWSGVRQSLLKSFAGVVGPAIRLVRASVDAAVSRLPLETFETFLIIGARHKVTQSDGANHLDVLKLEIARIQQNESIDETLPQLQPHVH